jgi:hypothetical protein
MDVRRTTGGLALAALGFLAGALTFYRGGGLWPAASPGAETKPAATGLELHKAPRQNNADRIFAPGHGLEWYKKLVSAGPTASGWRSELEVLEAVAPLMSLSKGEVIELLKDPSQLRGLGPPPNPWEGALLLRLSRLDPTAALEYLKKHLDQDERVMAAVLCQGMHSASLDECVAELAKDGRRGNSLQVLLGEMQASGDDALAFLLKHKDLVWTGCADRFLADACARDPREASTVSASLYAELHDIRSQNSLATAVRAWAKKDRAAAETWAQSLTGAAHTVANVALVKARIDSELPAAAGEMRALVTKFSASTKPGDPNVIQTELARGVNSTINGFIAQESVERASEWCTTLPPGAVREQGCRTIVRHWLEQKNDLPTASEWATRLTNQGDRDAVAPLIAMRVVASDPAAAVEWAKAISNADQRRSVLNEVFAAWSKDDPEAAAAAETVLTRRHPDK